MRSAIVELIIRGKNQTGAAFRGIGAEARSTLDRVKASFSGIQGVLASLGVAIGSGALVKYLVDVNAQFQQLQARLQTFAGSRDEARAIFDQLSEFAATTPFELQDSVEAFITLRSAGILPTLETLTALGNQASAFGGNIAEMAEAVRAATTGEMERLKRFGIVASIQGEKVVFTFKGIRTEVDRNAVAITNYLETLSRANFAGAMAREMETLGGQISNLKDNLFQLAMVVGEGGVSSAFAGILGRLNDFLAALRESPGTLLYWTRLIVQMVQTTVRTIVNLFQIAYRTGNGIGLFAKQAFLALQLMIAKGLDLVFKGARMAVDLINTLPGVHLNLQVPDLSGFLEQAVDEWNQGKDNIAAVNDAVTDDLKDLGQTWADLGKAALGSAEDQEQAAKRIGGLTTNGLAGGEGQAGGTAPAVPGGDRNVAFVDGQRQGAAAVEEAANVAAAAVAGLSLAMQGIGGDRAAPGGRPNGILAVFDSMTEGARSATAAVRELADGVEYLAGYLAVSFAGNWGDAWEAYGSGAFTAGQAVIQAGRKAIADYAGNKARATALDAGEALAKGLTNPIELLKAGKLFAISAGFGALAGLLGGRGGGGRGGSALGGGRSQRDTDRLAKDSDSVGTIVIEGGLLNLNDPTQAEALEKALNRLGRQRRVQVVAGGR